MQWHDAAIKHGLWNFARTALSERPSDCTCSELTTTRALQQRPIWLRVATLAKSPTIDASLRPMIRPVLFAGLAVLLLSCGCRPTSVDSKPSSDADRQVFQVKGVIVELEADGKTLKIKHEDIPGYMGAMTMPFEVKDTNELAGLAAGDSVAFRMIVTDTDGWIEQIRKLNQSTTNVPPKQAAVRLARDVEPLEEGDLLPDYQLINQDGQSISTSQFKGKALAITFLFTRCPFPTYCPLMSRNFAEVQSKLLAKSDGPTNWHLLTISFDPEFDKPEVLKGYAKVYGYDPSCWTFATGELTDVTAIAEQLGLSFWREDSGMISHNLRTAIIDTSGRLQKMYVGNQWTSGELVEEMVKAAVTNR
jgi:protein SCO1/2